MSHKPRQGNTGLKPRCFVPGSVGIGTVERPNQMSFGEQVVEALNEHIDARCSYNETRRGANAEYANPDEMNKTEARLQALLDKVRFTL